MLNSADGGGEEVKKLVSFRGSYKWITPKLSDWMSLLVTKDDRGPDPGHPRIQTK